MYTKRDRIFNSTIKQLLYVKPKGVTYYQFALCLLFCPDTKFKHLIIISDALRKYHQTDTLHFPFGLLCKSYSSYYGSHFTYNDFAQYSKRLYNLYIFFD